MFDGAAHELAMCGADNWIRRESANIADALKALEEKASLFRLYLSENVLKHKLLFASQYLVETSVQLLRTIDKAANESVVQQTARVAFVAQKLLAAARGTANAGAGAARPPSAVVPLSTLQSLLANALVTLSNAIWKRGIQQPNTNLRRQLDEGEHAKRATHSTAQRSAAQHGTDVRNAVAR